MTVTVFGSTSGNPENETDTYSLVQKLFLRTKFLKNKMEEDIDVKNQFRKKYLPDSSSIRKAAWKMLRG